MPLAPAPFQHRHHDAIPYRRKQNPISTWKVVNCTLSFRRLYTCRRHTRSLVWRPHSQVTGASKSTLEAYKLTKHQLNFIAATVHSSCSRATKHQTASTLNRGVGHTSCIYTQNPAASPVRVLHCQISPMHHTQWPAHTCPYPTPMACQLNSSCTRAGTECQQEAELDAHAFAQQLLDH